MDNDRYQLYCRQRYNYQHMLEEQRRQEQNEELNAPPKIETIVKMAIMAITKKGRSIKELAERKVRQWTLELLESVRYVGPLRKNIQDAIGALSHLDGKQKGQVWGLIELYLNQKPEAESVTRVS